MPPFRRGFTALEREAIEDGIAGGKLRVIPIGVRQYPRAHEWDFGEDIMVLDFPWHGKASNAPLEERTWLTR